MSLELVPPEIVRRIFLHLMNDSQAYIALASTCNLYNHLANDLHKTDEWKRHQPVRFLANPNKIPLDEQATVGSYNNHQVFVALLNCLFNCKKRKFSTIRFVQDEYLTDLHCIDRIQFSLEQTEALVGLELVDCHVKWQWLYKLLSHLPNLCYLSLKSIHGPINSEQYTWKSLVKTSLRKLDLLQLSCEIPIHIFSYVTDNFVSKRLDISRMSIRSWRHNPNSELSVMCVLDFLKRSQPFLSQLVADETNIKPGGLKRMLQDPELKQLIISVKDCPGLTRPARATLRRELAADEWARVIF